ncbi:MAG: hypothetical protein ABIH66_01850 [bacterium]
MFFVYWALVLITLDNFVLLAFTALYSMGFFLFSIPFIAYLLVLWFRKTRGFFYFLTPIQLTVTMIFILGVILSGQKHYMMRTGTELNSNVKVISGERLAGVPRLIIDRPEHGDVLTATWSSYGVKDVPGDYIECSICGIDRKSGKTAVWVKEGRVRALVEDPADGDIYAIAGKIKSDPAAPGSPWMTFNRFSKDGKLKSRISMGLPRSTYYVYNLLIREDDVIAIVENYWYKYDKRSDKLSRTKLNMKRERIVYFTAPHGDVLIATFASSLLGMIASGGNALMKINLKYMTVQNAIWGRAFGYYQIKRIPGSAKYVANSPWVKNGHLINENLKILKTIKIPPGVREIEVSADGKWLFAGGFFTGLVYFIDIKNNEIVNQVYVGKNIRGLHYTKTNNLLAGSNYGLVEVDLEKFTPFNAK